MVRAALSHGAPEHPGFSLPFVHGCCIVDCMFDVLVFLYENYWWPDACPDHDQLSRKLSAVGFDTEEIQEALSWLDGLTTTAQGYVGEQGELSTRLYPASEREMLGKDSLAFISFPEPADVLSRPLREMRIARSCAVAVDGRGGSDFGACLFRGGGWQSFGPALGAPAREAGPVCYPREPSPFRGLGVSVGAGREGLLRRFRSWGRCDWAPSPHTPLRRRVRQEGRRKYVV